MNQPTIRAERKADEQAIRQINEAAFGQSLEAELVDRLRKIADPFISLVAELDGQIVGHILFTAVTIGDGPKPFEALGLAPMAVTPDHQRHGIGSALVRRGLGACQGLGHSVVVVLGHPRYYPRFGFQRASDHGIRFEAPVPDEAFMVLELEPGALAGCGGTACYHPAFMEAES